MTSKIHILPPDAPRQGPLRMDVTSRGGQFRPLSPMLLGPVHVPGEGAKPGVMASNVENAWQYSKVYGDHDVDGQPGNGWYKWAWDGFISKRAERYPMGKGAIPAYSWWAGHPLDYIAARKAIYVPLYAAAVRRHQPGLFAQVQSIASDAERFRYPLTLIDFDAYDHHSLGMSLEDVLEDPTRKMGHGFVLAMMLAGLA